jgi:hypothetical protein
MGTRALHTERSVFGEITQGPPYGTFCLLGDNTGPSIRNVLSSGNQGPPYGTFCLLGDNTGQTNESLDLQACRNQYEAGGEGAALGYQNKDGGTCPSVTLEE